MPAKLITGSFVTKAAEYRNAENILVLHGNPALTQASISNYLLQHQYTPPLTSVLRRGDRRLLRSTPAFA